MNKLLLTLLAAVSLAACSSPDSKSSYEATGTSASSGQSSANSTSSSSDIANEGYGDGSAGARNSGTSTDPQTGKPAPYGGGSQ
ncbi:MAG: hypothetical protein K0S28_1147 [Paucimonas sp.]|jgi:hypothetical protein|nr:hypothetical protein [Paucimonas sp.]